MLQAGNKGACAVAFTVSGGAAGGGAAEPTRVLLLCCHLEAHSHRLQRRNANLRHILSTLHLKPPRSRRGLSQTLLTSFLPSHMSPLRGRSRTRASTADPRGLMSTSGHARGHSLPANTLAFMPQDGWPAAQRQHDAGLHGIAEATADGAGQHTRSQSVHGLTSPRDPDTCVAEGAVREDGGVCGRQSRRSASLPSGSMASLIASGSAAAACGGADTGPPAADPGLRTSHAALVASLQHWDCSRVDVGSDCGSDSSGSGTVQGAACGGNEVVRGPSGAAAEGAPGRYSGSDAGSWGFSDDCSTPVERGDSGLGSTASGTAEGGVPGRSASSGDSWNADSGGGGMPMQARESPAMLLSRRRRGRGSAQEGMHGIMQEGMWSHEALCRAREGADARVGGVAAGAQSPAIPRATTPSPASLQQARGGDGALMHGTPAASSGRGTPDLRSAAPRLGRDISTPKLATGLFGGHSSLSESTPPTDHRGPALQRAVHAAPGSAGPRRSARAAQLQADMLAAAEAESPAAAAVCEGMRGSGSASGCSSMHLRGSMEDSDVDSLAGALSASSDAHHCGADPGLALRYRAPPAGHVAGLAGAAAPAKLHSVLPQHARHTPGNQHRKTACRALAEEDAPLRAVPPWEVQSQAGQHAASAGMESRQVESGVRHGGGEGAGYPPPQVVVEGLQAGSDSSSSCDMRSGPASPGGASHVELQDEMMALAAAGRGSGGAAAVEQVAPPSPFAWRCSSRRQVRCALRSSHT